MKITPLDIQQQQFKTRFRGFDVREVDAFLEQMGGAFERVMSENESLREDIRRLKLESQGYKEREETFKRAMFNSQKVLEEMKKNAQKSAELVVAEAEVKAENEDIAELKRQRMQIEVQIRSIIESHAKLLEIGIEETQTLEEEDDKLKLLKKP